MAATTIECPYCRLRYDSATNYSCPACGGHPGLGGPAPLDGAPSGIPPVISEALSRLRIAILAEDEGVLARLDDVRAAILSALPSQPAPSGEAREAILKEAVEQIQIIDLLEAYMGRNIHCARERLLHALVRRASPPTPTGEAVP